MTNRSALRFTHSARYQLAQQPSSRWYLQRTERQNDTCIPRVIVGGPFMAPGISGAGGFALPYFDSTGSALALESSNLRIARIDLTTARTGPRRIRSEYPAGAGFGDAEFRHEEPAMIMRPSRTRRQAAAVPPTPTSRLGAAAPPLRDGRAGGVVVGHHDGLVPRGTLVARRTDSAARAVAPFGLNTQLANWTQSRNALATGALESSTVGVARGDSASVSIQRLTARTCNVVSVGRAGIDNGLVEAQRQVSMLVTVRAPSIQPAGLLLSFGRVDIQGSPTVTTATRTAWTHAFAATRCRRWRRPRGRDSGRGRTCTEWGRLNDGGWSGG
ncbi:hypothetical protein [Gemmatimonas sp.]|jgi:hypothetical protein|uniref:hypothetical protein n=1 Tax=Gemmatimonas sp. TaxID=1962908 RepID=UPI0037BECC4A